MYYDPLKFNLRSSLDLLCVLAAQISIRDACVREKFGSALSSHSMELDTGVLHLVSMGTKQANMRLNSMSRRTNQFSGRFARCQHSLDHHSLARASFKPGSLALARRAPEVLNAFGTASRLQSRVPLSCTSAWAPMTCYRPPCLCICGRQIA